MGRGPRGGGVTAREGGDRPGWGDRAGGEGEGDRAGGSAREGPRGGEDCAAGLGGLGLCGWLQGVLRLPITLGQPGRLYSQCEKEAPRRGNGHQPPATMARVSQHMGSCVGWVAPSTERGRREPVEPKHGWQKPAAREARRQSGTGGLADVEEPGTSTLAIAEGTPRLQRTQRRLGFWEPGESPWNGRQRRFAEKEGDMFRQNVMVRNLDIEAWDRGRARLVVLAAEVGGRWSGETANFFFFSAKDC